MPCVTFGPFHLDLATGELQRSGIAVKLQPQPSKLLVLLVQRAGELVTRDEIRQHVWAADTFVDFDQSVNFCVRQIRAALHDNADTPCYLETLPRRGYRFVAPVQNLSDRPANPEIVKTHAGSQSVPSGRRPLAVAIAIAAAIALTVAVGAVVRHSRLTSPRVPDPKANEEVQVGRFFLNKMTSEDTLTAIGHFETAARVDPQYAPAYAGLADSYNRLATVFVAGKPPNNVRLLALRAATRAIQLDPMLAEAHAALGYTSMHELDWTQAETSLRRAVELNPQYVPAHVTLASYLVAQHRFTDAIAEARRAVELEPASLGARHTLAWMLYFDRQYDAAISDLETILQMDRTYAMAQWRLGQVLLVAGRWDEAIRTLQAVAETTRQAPAVLGLLAMAYGEGLRSVEALQIVDELERRSPTQTVPPGAMTLAYLGIRDKSAAINALERAYADRDNYTIYIDVDPLMDSLRDEPRFQMLGQEIMRGTRSQSTKLVKPAGSSSR
jgi:DNA-binding winged helix-turn-helix (wHTH) protein/tetratricopeptide (TPR) repeat protein